MSQLSHHNTTFQKKQFPITLICDSITNAPNVGSIFRTADAFGVKELIFCGEHTPIGRRMTKTSRSTEQYVDYKIIDNCIDIITELKDSHYIIALEVTEQSQNLSEFKLNTEKPIALIIGNENFGISDAILKLTNAQIHINMYGNNSSMNVVQATSIALYELTKQMR